MTYEDQYGNEYAEDGGYEGMDGATMLQVLRGDYGPEAQAEALEAAGLEATGGGFEEGDEGESPDPWTQEVIAQSRQLETELGRELTGAELQTIFEHVEGTAYPDVRAAYDTLIARDMRNRDHRQAVGAEAFQEAEKLREAEEQLEREGLETGA